MKTVRTVALSSLIISAVSIQASNTYPGNGASGFGGTVGTGSVAISDTASSLTITLNRGAGAFNDDLVLYLDTQPGGYNDTSTFTDNGDGGRTAISGANNGNPSRTIATFAPGFGADYAVSMENSFIGVFDLSNPNNFTFLSGQGQSGINTDASYSITLNAAQMAQIGLTAGSGQTFFFEGSYISTSAYRANETIGASVTAPGDGSGNAGFNNPQNFTTDSAYTLMTVPEPSTFSLIGLGSAALLALRRRK
jgi:hypothetical protein